MGTPANIIVEAAQVFVDGTDIGYTEGGVTVEYGLEVHEKKVDQVRATVGVSPTDSSLTVSTLFAEAILANLKKAWNVPNAIVTGGGVDKLEFGIIDQELPEHELKLVGKTPDHKARTYTFWRAVITEPSAHVMQKADKTTFAVSFMILPDMTKGADKEFGKVEDTL